MSTLFTPAFISIGEREVLCCWSAGLCEMQSGFTDNLVPDEKNYNLQIDKPVEE